MEHFLYLVDGCSFIGKDTRRKGEGEREREREREREMTG